jgi:hypothetical protein
MSRRPCEGTGTGQGEAGASICQGKEGPEQQGADGQCDEAMRRGVYSILYFIYQIMNYFWLMDNGNSAVQSSY